MTERYTYEGPRWIGKAEVINDGKGGASVIVTDIITSYIQTTVSIAALISSALVFWFGYSRSRKSEQIKVARELADRIEVDGKKVGAFKVPQTYTPEEDNRTREIIFDIRGLLHEVKYFHYLIQTHEIKDESILWH